MRSPVEELVRVIWQDVLKIAAPGREENFFALGGHSLLATQVISRLRQAFGVEISILSLFAAPTIAEVARQVEQALYAEQSEPVPPVQPVTREQPLPLSFAQQRLWFLDQLEPGSSCLSVPIYLWLRGRLFSWALQHELS